MTLSARAQDLIERTSARSIKLGDLKALGRAIRKDHELALELWSTGEVNARLLSTLIFDPKLLSEATLDRLAADILRHEDETRNHLTDWLLANQLTKDKRLSTLMTTWEKHPSRVMRRLFWYHQARLRWMGQTPPGNTASLVDSLEAGLADAEPEVQWVMNFCACQIAMFEPEFRERCVNLTEGLGLYQGEHVSKGCTPSYLPEFLRIELAKRGLE